MLAVTAYPQDYIDSSRARFEAQLAAYRNLVASAAKGKAAEAARAEFEPLFFANLVMALENAFVHRTRAMEGKDGNPLNEVRMICTSLLKHGGTLTADKTIKYQPETSVLKLRIGDEIRLDEAQFDLLLKGFLAEIEQRFT